MKSHIRYITTLPNGQDLFIGKFGTYTQEEIELLDEEHRLRNKEEWEISNLFKNRVFLKETFSPSHKDIRALMSVRYEQLDEMKRHRWQCVKGTLEYKIFDDIINEIVKDINELKFFISKKKQEAEIKPDKDTAKTYPIDRLIPFNKAGFCNCLWHSEKTGSLKYYPKTNSVHCFGCGKSSDSIGVMMELEGLDFLAAVRRLNTMSS